jgi:hypothetical protein
MPLRGHNPPPSTRRGKKSSKKCAEFSFSLARGVNDGLLTTLSTLASQQANFINAKATFSMRHTLKELGHPQPPTPMQTDNKTANDLLTNKIMPKALQAMDMRFHWLQCPDAQGQFRYYWRPGTQTKIISPSITQQVTTRPTDPLS